MNSQSPEPVTFRFKNFGPVKDAEVELGNLTIIAGRNNTGKTYLVYTLYGFLRTWKGWPDADSFLEKKKRYDVEFPDIQQIIDKLNREGRASFPLDREQFRQQQNVVIQELNQDFSETALFSVFSSQQSDFEDSSIEVDFNEDTTNGTYLVKGEIREGVSVSMEYDGCHVVVSTGVAKKQGRIRDLQDYITYHYFLLLLQDRLPDPFILSAERFGISLFYRELDFTKNQLVDLLQKLGEDKSKDRFLT